MQCIVGRIQPISLCNPCVMSVHGSNNVGTLLRHASGITEQKKCWELLAEKFDRFQTLLNNMQQGVQTDATCNIQQCWELLANNVASVCTGLKTSNFLVTHYFYGGIVVCAYPIFCLLCSCSLLFFTTAHFHLAGR